MHKCSSFIHFEKFIKVPTQCTTVTKSGLGCTIAVLFFILYYMRRGKVSKQINLVTVLALFWGVGVFYTKSVGF